MSHVYCILVETAPHSEVVAVSTNVQIPDKKSAHLLTVDEQLFQPYAYVGVTLYLHFHVLNPN